MNNSGPVKVTANDEGEVVIQNENNPDFGYIRLEQEITSMEDGFLNHTTRSALVGGRYEELNEVGFTEGQIFPGKIVVEESLEPFYDNQQPKINPESGEILVKDGRPIYRQSRYTEDDSQVDSKIQHTNQMTSEAVSESVSEEQEEEEPVAIQ